MFSDFVGAGGGEVPQKLSGSSRRQGWVDRGTRDGDRLRRPTPGRKLRSGAGSKGLRMLTRQKAEPLLGMKLTLLRSGHRKGGISCRGLGLETQQQGHSEDMFQDMFTLLIIPLRQPLWQISLHLVL